MVVAPLVSGDEVFGALGHLLGEGRRLQPVGDRPGPGAGRPRRRLDEQRAPDRCARRVAPRAGRTGRRRALLREIAARISAATDLPAVLQLGVDEAARLLHADGARIDLIDPDHRTVALGLRVGRGRAQRGGLAGGPRRDRRSGHLRPGGRHRPGVLVGRLPQRHALPARPRGGPVRRRVRAPFGHGGPVERRGRPDRGADRLQQPRRSVGREGRHAARGHRRPGRDHHPHDPPDRRAGPLARGARPAGGGGAGAARDRRPDHHPARAGGDPPGRRLAGRAPGSGRRRDPRPRRPGDRQPPLGLRRRPVGHVQRRGAGAALDLGRGRGDRDRRRGGPGHRRRRRPRVALPAVARIDRVLRADRVPAR